jgi:hypothetical protein
MAEDEIPGYEDINMDDIEKVHEVVDSMDDYTPKTDSWHSEEDEPTQLEPIGSVYARYRTEAEVPKSQKISFDAYRGAYGRHVALSNTRRQDNPRHLMAIDLQSIWERIPTHAQRATLIRIRETSEFQMCRSNPETGGFEAKIGITSIRREDVDVKQSQSLIKDIGQKKKKGILGFLKR